LQGAARHARIRPPHATRCLSLEYTKSDDDNVNLWQLSGLSIAHVCGGINSLAEFIMAWLLQQSDDGCLVEYASGGSACPFTFVKSSANGTEGFTKAKQSLKVSAE
jgi:hypothetical protein